MKKSEDFLDLNLSVPISPRISLEDVIFLNCKPEIMDGENKY